jgi:hypothetical protein
MLFFIRHAYQEYWRLVRLYEVDNGEGTYFEHILTGINPRDVELGESSSRKGKTGDTPTWAATELAFLPPDIQEITWDRYQLILPLLKLSSKERTKAVVEERIKEFFDSEFQQKKKRVHLRFSGRSYRMKRESPKEGQITRLVITTRTASRWIARFQKSGGDIRALIPSFESSGPQELYMNPQIRVLLEQAISIAYTPYQQEPITGVLEEVRRLISQTNMANPFQEPLRPPSKRTVYRYVNSLNQRLGY